MDFVIGSGPAYNSLFAVVAADPREAHKFFQIISMGASRVRLCGAYNLRGPSALVLRVPPKLVAAAILVGTRSRWMVEMQHRVAVCIFGPLR
jgi:hypothetical protein